ncbi:hypothetical protein GCM10023160_03350 [Brachybacterium paraconglomeratum]
MERETPAVRATSSIVGGRGICGAPFLAGFWWLVAGGWWLVADGRACGHREPGRPDDPTAQSGGAAWAHDSPVGDARQVAWVTAE